MELSSRHDEMEQVRRRFEEFRGVNPPRSRFPENLWMAAAELASRYGVSATARRLGLAVPSLRKWVDKRAGAGKPEADEPNQRKTTAPAFVEFLAPAAGAVMHCSVEVESAQGAKLRLELKAVATQELAKLIHSFVNG